MNKNWALKAVLVFMGWLLVLGAVGYVAGQLWVLSLGADLMAIVGAWAGAIVGLVQVLLMSMKARQAH